MLGSFRKVVLRTRIEEGVCVTLKKRHVSVHTGSRVLGEWLWHESRVDALFDGNLFDYSAEGHDVIGHRQGICISQVDFILTRATFVVTKFHRNAELLEH